MKGKYSGIQTVDDFYQALFQDIEFFRKHGITHIRDINLYFTPCDENGVELTVRNSGGGKIDGYRGSGAYKCAADSIGTGNIEATDVLSKAGFKAITLKDQM